ncbi:MAG: P-type superfamily ATPase [Candidatus Berkelbacteria bacterium]|nr:P-type superfamily ATPase [Candidatus Berkelbacteria bacterium]
MEKIQKPWQRSSSDILRNLGSQKEGLDDFEADKGLWSFGFNSIFSRTPIPYLKIFFRQFFEVLILMLIFAAILSFFLGDLKNGLVLSIIVLATAIIGFSQEYKSERIIRARASYLPNFMKAKRSGIEKQIDTRFAVEELYKYLNSLNVKKI